MVLVDWEILMGGGLTLDSTYKVSGKKSLAQTEGKGLTFLVHKQTYGDSPLNVRITTWMTHEDVRYDPMSYFVGAIARKLSDKNTYIYWYLDLGLSENEAFVAPTADRPCKFVVGYYINGTQTQLLAQKIDPTDTYWNYGKWRYFKMDGYQIGDKYYVGIAMSAEIDAPDINNPPEEFIDTWSYILPTDFELQNGGACGIAVGSIKWTSSSKGRPFYDYTQLWY